MSLTCRNVILEAWMAGLRRALGLADAVAIGLGAVVGAGLFVVTAQSARAAGPAFLLALLIAAVAAACNALSSAQLAARYPLAGGTYEYGRRTLHPWAGFAAGWLFLCSKLAASGAVALGFSRYLGSLLGEVPERPVAVAAAASLTAVNLLGIQKAGRLNLAIVAVTLGGLLAFVACLAPLFDGARLAPFAPHGWSGVAEAAALSFFAYTGYARLATLGEEVADPRRTIPRAILATVVLAAALYVAVCLAAAGAVGADRLGTSPSPLHEAAKEGPPWLPNAVGVSACAAMLGVLLSQLLGISRMAFAMARRGDLPGFLATVSPRTGAPTAGVLLAGAVSCLLAALGTLEPVTEAAAFTILAYYGIANAAALRMERADRLYPDAVAWLGLLCCAGLALSLRGQAVLAGTALLLAGALWRVCWRAFRPDEALPDPEG